MENCGVSVMPSNKLSYRNKGFIVRHGSSGELADERTVVVMGVARSGTSMVCRILQELGVFMGERMDDAVLEDVEIAEALENEDDQVFKKIVNDRNSRFGIWGWKRPSSYKFIEFVLANTRNPIFIVPFRDLAAISSRNLISMQVDPFNNLRRTAEEFIALSNVLEKIDRPILLISYEKALQHRLEVVKTIKDFAGIDCDEQTLYRAASSIENGPAKYLEKARKIYIGQIDSFRGGKVRGWVYAVNFADHPVSVELRLGDAVHDATTANIFRKDLLEHGIGNGCHGFEFPIDGRVELDTLVDVSVLDSEFRLRNSGLPLNDFLK